MFCIYLNLIIVFVPAYFFPFSKKQWNKHSKFFTAENWMQLRIDINFHLFHVQKKKLRNKEVENKKRQIEKYILPFIACRISVGVLFWHQTRKNSGYKFIWNATCYNFWVIWILYN